MTIPDAIILAIVEGITEFLPVSSTGHLVLTANLLGLQHTDFVKTFEIAIQLGAILAIVVLYWKTLLTNIAVWKRIIAAFIPTAVVGFVLYGFIKDVLLGNTAVTLWALFTGGVLLIILEYMYKEQKHHAEKIEHIPLMKAAGIGLFQSLSVVPGVSRAAASIIGGLFMGARRSVAVEFSFFLAVPTIFAATVLDLTESRLAFTSSEWTALGVGFVVSFFVALVTVYYFLKYVKKHSFVSFGIYRILLSVLYWFFIVR